MSVRWSWSFGIVAAVAVAWAAGALLLNNVQPRVYDPQISLWVAEPGTVFRSRSEGWASSMAGAHGIRGLPDGVLPQGPRVVIWGDSFVEGAQVPDGERVAEQTAAMLKASGLPLGCVGIGHGGDSLIDSLFKLPQYAPVLEPVALHVFFIGKLTDILPDIPHGNRAQFRSKPQLELTPPERQEPSPLARQAAPMFYRFEMSWLYEVYFRLKNLRLRLGPGPVPLPDQEEEAPARLGDLQRAWGHLLAELSRRAGPNILVVYGPPAPLLNHGEIRRDDPAPEIASAFALACAQAGVSFLDLEAVFVEHFNRTGRFARGFFNSPPGTGHLNRDGHRLAAQVITRHILEREHALLAR